MLKRTCAIALWIGLATAAFAAQGDAATSPTLKTAPHDLLAAMRVVRLDNGMVFLICPNRRAPVFSGVIRFDVGGKDEKPGTTGIAHMFEHMAFKGTPQFGTKDYAREKPALEKVTAAAKQYDRLRSLAMQPWTDKAKIKPRLDAARKAFEQAQAEAQQYVVPNEFDQIYSREGGSDMNASTSSDATTYYVSLPSNRLELWMKMESARISEPVMREFYKERSVILEERRMRNDNDPISRLWDVTMATAFVASPYGYPVIGWSDDIANLEADEAYRFFRQQYTPDRAVGVLVGDLDVERTRQMLVKHFGPLKPRPAGADAPRITSEPKQAGERIAKLAVEAQPTLLLGWHKPCAPDPADVQAELLMQVITGGRSARWFEKLVKKERLAADCSAFSGPGEVLPNLFMIYSTPQGKTTLDQLQAAILAEVDRLRKEPVTAEELTAAKKMLRADTMRSLEDNLGMARELAEAAQIGKDPYYLETRLRQIEAVTAADIQKFAQTYLIDDNMTVGRMEK
ncbi:insulinase family protein [bacterium]|nr:insulinase family protein [bacterium]